VTVVVKLLREEKFLQVSGEGEESERRGTRSKSGSKEEKGRIKRERL